MYIVLKVVIAMVVILADRMWKVLPTSQPAVYSGWDPKHLPISEEKWLSVIV